MKALIISDSHGNIKNLEHVVEFGKKIGVGAVIHCGDWNTSLSVEAVLKSKIPLYTVLGNADIDPQVKKKLNSESKSFAQEVLFVKLGGKRILVSHFISKLKKFKDSFDVGFYGHRHTPDKSVYEGKSLIRPGALESDINFVIYDTDTDKIEFLNDKI